MESVMMKFDELVQLQVLKRKSSGRGPLLEHFIENAGDAPELRQMCAKVSQALYTRLEEACVLLDLTKREFIEAAVGDALDRAEDSIERAGILERQGSL
jgi:hypothetical protein